MIDLHCHILPGIDDGPADLDESLALARALHADGVHTVASTPHMRFDHPSVRPRDLASRREHLQRELDSAGIAMKVVSAAEVDLMTALETPAEELRLASFGQRGECLLVETPYGFLSSPFEEMLFRAVSLVGLRVLLAHPERNPSFQAEPERLADLVRRGVLLQVTAPALVDRRRSSASRKLALALIEGRLAHVLASDSHSPTGGRRPQLSAAVAAAARVAPARAEWMTTDAPAALLAGEPLPPAPVESSRPRAEWRRRFRRP